jgi:hypothetical protein
MVDGRPDNDAPRLHPGQPGVSKRYFDPECPVAGHFHKTESSAVKIQAALFGRFAESGRQAGSLPIVLLLPEDRWIVRSPEGKPTICEPLVTYFRAERIDYVGAAEAFRRGDSGHHHAGMARRRRALSPGGERIVAS